MILNYNWLWLVGRFVLWHINHRGSFDAESFLYKYIKYMTDILNDPELIFSTVKWFHLFLSNTNTQLNNQTILLQTIQFSISIEFLAYTLSFV